MIKSYKIYNSFIIYEKGLNAFINIYKKIINKINNLIKIYFNNLLIKFQLNTYLIKSKFLLTPFNLESDPGKVKIESNILEALN